MLPLLGRLLLLLLLTCDWAAAPSHGTSPLSRSFASTDSYCYSLMSSEDSRLHCSASSQLDFLCHAPFDGVLPSSSTPHVAEPVVPLSSHRILYILMSIRR